MDECKPLLLGQPLVFWKNPKSGEYMCTAEAYTRPLFSST